MTAAQLACGLLVIVATSAAVAGPLDKPAFTASPAELLAEAAKAGTPQADVVALREDQAYTIAADGGFERRHRVVFVVRRPDADAVQQAVLAIHWQPSYQRAPSVRVRMISPDGTATELAARSIITGPAQVRSATQRSEAQQTTVTLPTLEAGAVVEQEVTLTDIAPMLAAGTLEAVPLADAVPVVRKVITVSRPTARAIVLALRGPSVGAALQTQVVGDRTVTTLEVRNLLALDPPRNPPPDHVGNPTLLIATGKSWRAVAADYRALVEERLAAGVVLPADAVTATPRATVDRVLAWMQARVVPDGFTFTDGGVVPAPPADVLLRSTAGVRDRAALLVAALRAAHITADLALVSTTDGPDADPAAPALDGFDHVLVRATLGRQELWIDPSEPTLAAGVLPLRTQGRRALVLAAKAKRLVTTPRAPAAANFMRQQLVYRLPAYGKGALTIRYESRGALDRDPRWMVATTPLADLRPQFTAMATQVFRGELTALSHSAVADVTTPFTLDVTIANAEVAVTEAAEAKVVIRAADVLSYLAEPLFAPGDQVERAFMARSIDYVWANPLVVEQVYRLELPLGYAAPTLQVPPTRALGAMRLTTTTAIGPGTFTLTFRLDTGKPRITADQARATRAAVAAMLREPPLEFAAASEIQALVARGQPRAAIDATRALVQQAPREPMHHLRLAKLYIDAGMGAAARRETTEAMHLAPTSALAWVTHGDALNRDPLGRLSSPGADRAGAEAAFRNALSIEPGHSLARWRLSEVLLFDANGRPRSDAKALREAIELLRAWPGDDTATGRLTLALTMTGDAAGLDALGASLPPGARHDEVLVTATALRAGGAAAARQAHALAGDDDEADQLIQRVALHMVNARRYDDARALDQSKAKPTGGDWLRRLAPVEPASSPADPLTPYRTWVAAALRTPVANPPWGAHATPELTAALQRDPFSPQSWPDRVAIDVVVSNIALVAEGNARTGWRVRVDKFPGWPTFYVAMRGGRATLVAGNKLPRALGHELRDAIARDALPQARQWLRWFLDDSPDPSAPAAAWLGRRRATLATASHDELLLAAWMIGAEEDPAQALPVLDRCADSTDLADHGDCQRAVVLAHRRLGDLAAAERAARAWIILQPARADATIALATVLALAGDRKQAATVLDALLATQPDEPTLLWCRAEVALPDGWAAGAPWIDRIVAKGAPTDLNDAAWLRVYYDPGAPAARQWIDASIAAGANRARVNTLAVLLANADQPAEAWAKLLSALATHAPMIADLYAMGRMAESYGLRDDAIAQYRAIPRPEVPGLMPDAWDFAQQRLKALGVTP